MYELDTTINFIKEHKEKNKKVIKMYKDTVDDIKKAKDKIGKLEHKYNEELNAYISAAGYSLTFSQRREKKKEFDEGAGAGTVHEIATLKDKIGLNNLSLDVLNQLLDDINYNVLTAALKVINEEYKGAPLYYKKITARLEKLVNDNNFSIVNNYKVLGKISLNTYNRAAIIRHKERINNARKINISDWYNSIDSYIFTTVNVPTRRELLKKVKIARAKYMEYEKTLKELKDLKSHISDLMSGATKSFYGLDK